MGSENTITVVGTLGKDPELRYLPNGSAVVNGSVAVNRSWTNRSGEKVEQTDWFNWKAWREMAENTAESLRKGHRVIITGRLTTRNWETEDGQKRSIVELEAEEIGPSLRRATAAVTKITKSGASEWKSEEASNA